MSRSLSTVTAILPRQYAHRVTHAVTSTPGSSAFVWDARGTLLREHWYSQFLPSISPAKTMLQLLVPDHEVKRVVGTIVEEGNLHLQATGAVFCTGCEEVYTGTEFHSWPVDEGRQDEDASHNLRENLDVIFCIVEPTRTEAIARAAIRAGGHGPVVYFGEGRGLRDRLGWLRITKQQTKEVITVMADKEDADEIFTAMAKAGQLHLPGRGFMYRMPVETGMFNLPSRVAHYHHAANMQQIINAIDHLSGHTHWRDQTVFSNADTHASGIELLERTQSTEVEEQVSLAGIVRRDQHEALTDLFLDSGAAGVNVSHVRYEAQDALCEIAGARVNVEYSLLRCITSARRAGSIHAQVVAEAPGADLHDLCLFMQPVCEVATYIPSEVEYRQGAA